MNKNYAFLSVLGLGLGVAACDFERVEEPVEAEQPVEQEETLPEDEDFR